MRDAHLHPAPAGAPAAAAAPGGAGDDVPAGGAGGGGAARASLNPLRANFRELYERHLCRHSQYGLNVLHLAGQVATYLALFGLAWAVVPSPWVPAAVVLPYLAVLAFNVPARVLALTAAFLALFFALFAVIPAVSWWWYPLAVVVLYKLQAWSHKLFPKASDMTEFDRKYPKGVALFVLLTVYELPIQLNYLFFGRKDWRA